jgi:hypothetical protein
MTTFELDFQMNGRIHSMQRLAFLLLALAGQPGILSAHSVAVFFVSCMHVFGRKFLVFRVTALFI